MYDDYNHGVRQVEHGLESYVTKVFGWMFLGLTLTTITALFTISSPAGMAIRNPLAIILLSFVELGLVVSLSWLINKMSASTATMLFLIYSALNGITLSGIFYVYNIGLIFKAFAVTGITFGIMAAYGYFTKTDLTRAGNLFRMGVVGVLIAMLINLFVMSSMFDLIISFIGLFLFLGLVAYDTQKIKSFYALSVGAGKGDSIIGNTGYGDARISSSTGEMARKGAIISALSLYLDFINIFLFLLRIFGSSRD